MSSTFLRPLSIGEILDGAFSLYRSRFTTLVGAMLLLFAPALVLGVAADVVSGEGALAAILWLATSLFQGLAGLASFGACIWIASETVLGRSVSMGDALRKGIQKMVPVFLGSVILVICLILGFCLLIVPGILVWVMWFAMAPILVLEDRWDFFGRSRDLARGSWLKIFVVMVLYSIIASLPLVLVEGGGMLALGLADYQANVVRPAWMTISSLLGSALLTPFSHCALTLLYYDQRVRKEGLDVELAARAVGSVGTASPATHP